jgi:hypothetical protein
MNPNDEAAVSHAMATAAAPYETRIKEIEGKVGALQHNLGETKGDLRFCSEQRQAHIETINDLRSKLDALQKHVRKVLDSRQHVDTVGGRPVYLYMSHVALANWAADAEELLK